MLSFLVLSVLSAISSAAQVCPIPDSLCITTDAVKPNCMTIHSKALGWAAFGIGTSMADASNIFFVSGSESRHLESTGYRQPTLKAEQGITASPLLASKPEWANTAVSFCVTDPTLFASTNFIFAASDKVPRVLTATKLSFGMHGDDFGLFQFQFQAAAPTSIPSSAVAPSAVETIVPTSVGATTPPVVTISPPVAPSNPAASPPEPIIAVPVTAGPPAINSQVCPIPGGFCIIGDAAKPTCLTIHAKASGWAAFGVGTSMDDLSDLFFASGTETRHLEGTGYSQPTLKAVQSITASALLAPKPAWAKTSSSFCVTDPSLLAGTNFIFAASDAPPRVLTATTVTFGKHGEDRGQFQFQFGSKGGAAAAPGKGLLNGGAGNHFGQLAIIASLISL